jgi:tetratricopeptide (TPR) repeat protein
MRHFVLLILLTISSLSFSQEEDQNDFFLADTYYRQGEFEKATQIFKKLYDKSPFNTTYLSKLIACYQESNNFKTAEDLLKNRIKQDASKVYLYVFLGYNYERQQQQELADSNYQKAINSLDKNPEYSNTIGNLFKFYNLLDNAILAFEIAMQQNPNANYNFQIAQIYGEKGDYQRMFESYLELLDKNKSYLSLVQRYASQYITDDSENETNILFKKTLLRKSVSNAKDEWNTLLSWLFAQQKEYGKALIQEKALYNRNAFDLAEIFSLGKLAFDNKDYETAKLCFDFISEKTSFIDEKINTNLYLAKIAVATRNPATEKLFESLFTEFGITELTITLQVE